jgi:hypothetical protein
VSSDPIVIRGPYYRYWGTLRSGEEVWEAVDHDPVVAMKPTRDGKRFTFPKNVTREYTVPEEDRDDPTRWPRLNEPVQAQGEEDDPRIS